MGALLLYYHDIVGGMFAVMGAGIVVFFIACGNYGCYVLRNYNFCEEFDKQQEEEWRQALKIGIRRQCKGREDVNTQKECSPKFLCSCHYKQ